MKSGLLPALVSTAQFALASLVPSPTCAEITLIPGVLERLANGCTLLSTLYQGSFLLENYGTFVAGDSVAVTTAFIDVHSCNGQAYTRLASNSIASYRDFDLGCGLLSVDPEYDCPFLSSAKYGLIGFAWHGGFASGDSVSVSGDFSMDCTAITPCAAPLCLQRNTIASCQTPVRPLTWGLMKARFR